MKTVDPCSGNVAVWVSPPRPSNAASERSPASDRIPAISDRGAVSVAVVVPAFNEEANITATLSAIPSFVARIIVIDDASVDATAAAVRAVADRDPRIELLRNESNLGVGGSMVRGYRRALQHDAEIVVKMDGDGQMSPADLPALLEPLLNGSADYAKGNRFRDFAALRQMPLVRRIGNMGLSFLTKAAVGYWNCFDPCNGYVAIRSEVLARLDLERLGRSFFFETSMLAELYLLDAVVRDVPLPARYGDETSSLRVGRVLGEFPLRLLGCFTRRMVLKNLVYDFSLETIYLLSGLPLLIAGLLYGGLNWVRYGWLGEPAPTGTVVISAMLIILGFQLLLSAIGEDLRRIPTTPLSGRPLLADAPTERRPATGVARPAGDMLPGPSIHRDTERV